MRSGKLFHFFGSLLPSYKREKIILPLQVLGGIIPWLSSGQDLDFQCMDPGLILDGELKSHKQGSVLSTPPEKREKRVSVRKNENKNRKCSLFSFFFFFFGFCFFWVGMDFLFFLFFFIVVDFVIH